jgi:hypothetical protein
LIERHALADALVCLPGSHSKWAVVKQGGVLESFKSFMTGEIFALLQNHSILKFSVDDSQSGVLALCLGFCCCAWVLLHLDSVTCVLVLQASMPLGPWCSILFFGGKALAICACA